MDPVRDDPGQRAEQFREELVAAGYRLDGKVGSLAEIDRFCDDRLTGIAPEEAAAWACTLGDYLGEALRRALGGDWVPSSEDPADLRLALPDGTHIWPVVRAQRRLRHGRAEALLAYAMTVIDDARRKPVTTRMVQRLPKTARLTWGASAERTKKRPWWRFW